MTEDKVPTNQSVAANNTHLADEIDIGELLGILLDGRWWIAIFTALALLVGGLYAFLATPIYESDVLVQVEDSGAGMGAFDEMSSFMGEEAASETEIEVLRSRYVVGRVVERLQLDIILQQDDILFGYVNAKLLLPVKRFDVAAMYLNKEFKIHYVGDQAFNVYLEDTLLGTGKAGTAFATDDNGVSLFIPEIKAEPGTMFSLVRVPFTMAIAALQRRLVVSEKGKKTGVIRVSLQGPDAPQIKETLNTLANAYLQQNVERKSEEAEKSLAFLDKQLPTLRRELDAAEVALNNYLSENRLVDLTAESQTVLDQLVDIEQQLSGLELKRAELRQEFKDQHPALVALGAQNKQLASAKEALEKEISALPETQQRALRLKRDVEVNSVLYTFLLNKAQELRVIKAGTVGNVRILDKAFLAYSAIKPKKALIWALSMVLGVIIGVMFVFIRRALNRGVRSPEEIEQKLGLSVYSVVPFSQTEEKFTGKKRHKGSHQLLAAASPKDQAIEALRSLRTSLHFALMDAKNNRVVISGPSPGIGKSFISSNLGYLLAETDKKVLLIDADMRKGHCHEYFDAPRDYGLSELISRPELKTQDVLKQHPQEKNFSLISTGEIPPNPSELLLSQRFITLLDELSAQFDIVIIDTPPIMAVADAGIVLPHAGAGFVVARVGMNPVAEVEAAVKRLTQDGGKISGVLLNGMQRAAGGYKYGSYKYYQYDYK